jgi:hypothetical protein
VLIEKQIPKNKKLEHAGLEAHAHALASYFFSFLIGRTTRPYLLKKKRNM